MKRPSLLYSITKPWTVLAALICVAACTRPADTSSGRPAPYLALVDSLALLDTGAFALGDLAHAGFHVADDGFWVGDRQNGRILRFGRDGRLVGQVGRKGRGPGELGATGPLVALHDGVVVAWDYGNDKLIAFDGDAGTLRWEVPVREQAFPMQLQAVGDTLWFGAVSLVRGTGAMRLMAREAHPIALAPAPAEYTKGLAYSFPYSVAMRLGDTLLVGYSGYHRLFLHLADDRIDSLIVPARKRRGVPADLLQQAEAGLGKQDGRGLENHVSSLSRAARLPDGSIALVHYDVDFDHRSDAPATVDGWLTVLDPSFQRACVDAPLPLAERSVPSLAFRADTLFALEHVIAGTQSTAVVRAFTISTAECSWVSVARE